MPRHSRTMEVRCLVERPLEQVFTYFCDFDHMQEWRPTLLHITRVDKSRVEEQVAALGRLLTISLRVVMVRPNRLMQCRYETTGMHGLINYMVRAGDNATETLFRQTIEVSGLWGDVRLLRLVRQWRRLRQQELTLLKQNLEGRP